MKTAVLLLSLIILSMCQGHTDPELPELKDSPIPETSVPIEKEEALSVGDQILDKSSQVIALNDYHYQLTGVVFPKRLYKESDFYELNYRYPYLDGEHYALFNNYIESQYLDIRKVVNQILDDKEMQCNDIPGDCDKDIKYLDYKIYSLSEEMLSVLLYQENIYANVAHSSYKFDCLNFDLEKRKFVKFDDFFREDTDSFVFEKINETITNSRREGDLYFECWELTQEDFEVYKDNFVINDENLVYYFDDCVVCPAFTGTYSIEIPMDEIMQLLNIYNESDVVSYVNN